MRLGISSMPVKAGSAEKSGQGLVEDFMFLDSGWRMHGVETLVHILTMFMNHEQINIMNTLSPDLDSYC